MKYGEYIILEMDYFLKDIFQRPENVAMYGFGWFVAIAAIILLTSNWRKS